MTMNLPPNSLIDVAAKPFSQRKPIDISTSGRAGNPAPRPDVEISGVATSLRVWRAHNISCVHNPHHGADDLTILRPCFVSPSPRRRSQAITTVTDTTGTSRPTRCGASARPAEAQSSPSLRVRTRRAARRSPATTCTANDRRHQRARHHWTASETPQRRPLTRSISNRPAESLSNGEFVCLHETSKERSSFLTFIPCPSHCFN